MISFMFFVSFLCGEMLLSVHIYENVFLYRCTAHWATMATIPAYLRKIVYAALHTHMKTVAQPVFI